MHIASVVDNEVHTSNVFVTRLEERSVVNQKKLEKADQKIKQKKEQRKDEKVIKPNEYEVQEASASHAVSKKDTKAETSGLYHCTYKKKEGFIN